MEDFEAQPTEIMINDQAIGDDSQGGSELNDLKNTALPKSGYSLLNSTDDENPLLVVDANNNAEDDDQPIVLNARQPSFSSLHGKILIKGTSTSSLPVCTEIEQVEEVFHQIEAQPKTVEVQQIKQNTEEKRKRKPFVVDVSDFEVPKTVFVQNRRVSPTITPKPLPEHLQPATKTHTTKKDRTFLTQVSDRVKVNSDQNGNKKNPYIHKQTVSPPKPASLFPKLNQKKVIDLSVYDIIDREPDLSKIPKELLDIIKHSQQSLVFHAICGERINTYSQKVVDQVVNEIRGYLDVCIDKNMINGGAYVKYVLEEIKNSCTVVRDEVAIRLSLIESKIEEVMLQLDTKEKYWNEQKTVLEAEKDVLIAEIDLKHEEAMTDLEIEWNSDKLQQRYNKPSAKLIGMRQMVKAQLEGHRFEDAALLADRLAEAEEQESSAASFKMFLDFKNAQEQLTKKYQHDKDLLEMSYDSKMNGIIALEIESVRPLKTRLESLKKMHTATEREVRKRSTERCITPEKKGPPSSAKLSSFSLNSKLKLPPLIPTTSSMKKR